MSLWCPIRIDARNLTRIRVNLDRVLLLPTFRSPWALLWAGLGLLFVSGLGLLFEIELGLGTVRCHIGEASPKLPLPLLLASCHDFPPPPPQGQSSRPYRDAPSWPLLHHPKCTGFQSLIIPPRSNRAISQGRPRSRNLRPVRVPRKSLTQGRRSDDGPGIGKSRCDRQWAGEAQALRAAAGMRRGRRAPLPVSDGGRSLSGDGREGNKKDGKRAPAMSGLMKCKKERKDAETERTG
ncbi:hypothetical protein NL676_000540 [Syzygium grande]|nr:hypothetical protein NL676_000540 [Syzygium grande]